MKVILSVTDTKSASQENQSNRLKVFIAWTDRLKVWSEVGGIVYPWRGQWRRREYCKLLIVVVRLDNQFVDAKQCVTKISSFLSISVQHLMFFAKSLHHSYRKIVEKTLSHPHLDN